VTKCGVLSLCSAAMGRRGHGWAWNVSKQCGGSTGSRSKSSSFVLAQESMHGGGVQALSVDGRVHGTEETLGPLIRDGIGGGAHQGDTDWGRSRPPVPCRGPIMR
jgi:hypothetical protein